ncbi:hypothetical protein ACFX13_024111 [Malus domestica]
MGTLILWSSFGAPQVIWVFCASPANCHLRHMEYQGRAQSRLKAIVRETFEDDTTFYDLIRAWVVIDLVTRNHGDSKRLRRWMSTRRPFSLRQDRYEFPNFQEESAVSEQNPSSDTAPVASADSIEFQGKKKQISREVKGFYSHCCQAAMASERRIRGEKIPTSLGQISDLTYLSLSGNLLIGVIPSSLGLLASLEVLELSSNYLTGSLPANNNLMKCNADIGNPYLHSCAMFSLSQAASDSQGRVGDSQPFAASPMGGPTQESGNGFSPIEIASITSAVAIVSVLLALVVLFLYTRKWNPKSGTQGSTRKEVTVFTNIGVPLTFENVVRGTGSFTASNCIGNGGFGATYKAEISPGIMVAIKRLSVGRFQGVQQFHAEIKTLGRLRHPNLVTLLGYHASDTEMFLIYNYLAGGNLEKFIQERSTRAVDWRVLHKIALDIARALAYLHDQCVPRVLHRDVKPSNILLDDDFNAYLSGFGLARLLGTSETHATTGVAGTIGYIAPEYTMTCRVSDKADVYSYGVVLLELLSDKKALDPSFSSYGNGFNIVQWSCMLLRQGRAKEFFTAGLWDAGPHDDLVEVLHLAVVCTVDSLSTRPTMRQVVRRLKQLQPPSC